MSQNGVSNTSSSNQVVTNYSIRLAQEVEINRERLTNLRISSASDICIVLILIIFLGVVIYYVISTVVIKQ
jgi:hypothetical protein